MKTYDELNIRFPTILNKNLCECPEGWYDLIWYLCEEIEEINKSLPTYCQIVCIQVKSKFNNLRFYHTLSENDIINRVVDNCIRAAEIKASYTCERCGGKREAGEYVCDKCKGEIKNG